MHKNPNPPTPTLRCHHSKRVDEANLCGMLEFQIWNTLPAFMAWARDGAQVWQ